MSYWVECIGIQNYQECAGLHASASWLHVILRAMRALD